MSAQVIELEEFCLTHCAGKHKHGVSRPTRGCSKCGRAWCGVHASVLDNYRCRGCGNITVPLLGATIRMKERA